MSFDPSDVDDLIDQSGSLVWQGEMAISGERNRPVVTAIPLAPILQDKGPGVYLAVVDRADLKAGEERSPAANWILVSNLGLTAYTGRDGMDVAVRSLADAKPLAGVTLRLYARNNGELALAHQRCRRHRAYRRRAVAWPRRRRAVRGDGLRSGQWCRRRLQLSRSRARRLRPVGPRRQRPAASPARSTPISTPTAASTAPAKRCI